MHAGASVAALLDHADHHGMRDAQTRLERFGLRFDQALERLLVPSHKALGGFLLFDLAELLGVVARLCHEFRILDFMFRRLSDDHALGVKTRASGAAGYLMELAGAQTAHLVAVEFGECCEHHGVDRDVDAHAQGVGAADHG